MSLEPPPLPVQVVVPGESPVDREGAFAESFQIHGLLRALGPTLLLEWSGIRRVAQADRVTRSVEEPLPVRPHGDSAQADRRLRLRDRWWPSRLELWPVDHGLFEALPGGAKQCVVLRFARRDWPLVVALQADWDLEPADAALRAAEQLPELPPGPSHG